MRVLIVSGHFPTHKDDMAHSFVSDLAVSLAKRGISVHVAKLSAGEDVSLENLQVYSIKSSFISSIVTALRVLSFTGIAALRYPFKSIKLGNYARHITSLVDTIGPNVVHAFFAYPEGVSAIIAKRLRNVPVVIEVLGHDVEIEPTIKYGLRHHPYIDRVVRQALTEADSVIAGSETLLNEASALLAGGDDKVTCIPPGVDIERFHPGIDPTQIRKKFGIATDETLILTIRKLSAEYGIDYLLLAAAELSRKGVRPKFLIGGEGPDRKILERKARELGVSELVIFAGQVPRSQVEAYMAAADIYLDPCLLGQGVSSLEAMASGKPVVGFKAFTSKIMDGDTGYLAENKNPRDLADRLESLTRDPNLRKRMGEKSRRITEEQYNIEKNTDEVVRIYRALTD